MVVTPRMLRFPYHTRYELIEFAVFTLAARVQRLVALHGACVGRAGRGVLLLGPSGAGKSTVTLQCLIEGLGILSEDSVFVTPDTLLATGVSNFCTSVRTRCAGLRRRPRHQKSANHRSFGAVRAYESTRSTCVAVTIR